VERVGVLFGSSTAGQWFGPSDPLQPQAPAEVAGRRFDYPTGYNTSTTPRKYEPTSFATLRQLADNFDLVRLLIETRKDQMGALEWNIRPRQGQNGKPVSDPEDPAIRAIEDFFQSPDRENSWDDWLRQLLEELFVTDAPSIWRQPTRGGQLYALQLIDGASVVPVLDEWGRRPAPPLPAYQQILKGTAAIDYTSDELIYRPRNKRVWKVYGFSPVEQILMTVNIALRRQLFQLQYFTEGNIPDSLIGTPDNWTPDQIKQFQVYFDSVLAGNTAARRKAIFLPGGIAKMFIQTKEPDLKGQFDEWLARVCCYAFSISPQAFVKEMNRATSETAKETAEKEGLAPVCTWVRNLMNSIIANDFRRPDLEFAFNDDTEIDPSVDSQIQDRDIRNGSKTINEVRAARGQDPVIGGEKPYIFAGNTIIRLEDAQLDPVERAAAMAAATAPTDDSAASQGEDGEDTGKPSAAAPGKSKPKPAANAKDKEVGKAADLPFRKAAPPNWRALAPPSFPEERVAKAVGRLSRHLAKFLKAEALTIAEQLDALRDRDFSKAEDGTAGRTAEEVAWGWRLDAEISTAADQAAFDALIQGVLDELQFTGFAVLAEPEGVTAKALGTLFKGGVLDAFETVSAAMGTAVEDVGVASGSGGVVGISTAQVNARSIAFAEARAAEMVGMTRDAASGALVPSADARYVISEATRDMIRAQVAEAVRGGMSVQEIAALLEDAYAFSPARADLIARTELVRANNEGNLAGYKASGVVTGKGWQTAEDELVEEICEHNAAAGILPLDDDFPSGDPAPPAHPRCRCAIYPAVEDVTEEAIAA